MLARWRLINPLLIGNITSLTPAVSSIHNRSLTKRDLCVGSSSDGEDGPSQYDIESLLKNIHNERKARHKKEEKKIIREKRQDIFTIDALVNFLKEENAQEICVIKVPDDLQYVSYFVTCTAVSGRHIQRIAEAICYQVFIGLILNLMIYTKMGGTRISVDHSANCSQRVYNNDKLYRKLLSLAYHTLDCIYKLQY
jgi:hypothetical protein